jgi:hypothetical protein
MASELDYYSWLSRAVARLGGDSYEARGAVYDRARKILIRKLTEADPAYTFAEIAREQRSFRDAIRRIEFGDEADLGIPEAAPEVASPRRVESRAESSNQNGKSADRPSLLAFAARLRPNRNRNRPVESAAPPPKRRSVAGRVASRLVIASLLLGIVGAFYAFVSGLDLRSLRKLVNDIAITAGPAHAGPDEAELGGTARPLPPRR